MNRLPISDPFPRNPTPRRPGIAWWVVLGVFLGAVGCGTRSIPEPVVLDVDLPETWAALDDAVSLVEASLDRWWDSFGDPLLGQRIDEGLERNNTLRSASLAVDQALAQAEILGADTGPQIHGEVEASRRQQVFVGLPIPGGPDVLSSTSTSYGLRLNVSWEVDLWGRLRARQQGAMDDVQAARAEASSMRLSLAGQIARLWFVVAESEDQVNWGEATVASFGETREWVEARYRNGLASAVELRLARANEAQSVAVLERRRRQLDGVVRQLEVLLGRYPRAELERPLALPEAPGLEIPVALPAEILTRRPDLVALEHRLQGAGWRLAEARRALFPRLTLTAAGGTLSDDVGDLLDENFSLWNLAGGLLQPIFQSGRLRAAIEFRHASRERVLAEYVQAILGAFGEVERALAAERWLRAEEQALAEAAAEANAAFQVAEERFRHGVGTYLEQLESQRLRFAAESRWLTVRRQRLENRIDLFLALGGGFENQESP